MSYSIYGQDKPILIVLNGDTVAVLTKEEFRDQIKEKTFLKSEIKKLSLAKSNLEIAYGFLLEYSKVNELSMKELEQERDQWKELFELSDDEYNDLMKRCRKARVSSFVKGAVTGLVVGTLAVLILSNT